MSKWTLILLLFLFLPSAAGRCGADISVTAREYFDEFDNEWHLVESIRIEQLNNNCENVEQDCGGVADAQVYLNNLPVESEYRVYVRWVDGATWDETYVVYEPGDVCLWVDHPECY